MSLHTSDLVLVPGQQLPPLETISGFQVRPGFFRFFGVKCYNKVVTEVANKI